MKKISIKKETLWILLVASVCGGVAGGFVARIFPTSSTTDIRASDPDTRSTTTTEPVFVRVEPGGDPYLVPPKSLVERASPVATIYRKASGVTPDARTLDAERELGRAVSLTSDGWFVAMADEVDAMDSKTLSLWYNEKSYTPTRLIRDTLNGTVFIKIDARDLSSPVFGDVEILSSGSEAWLEREAHALNPAIFRTVHLSSSLPASQSSAMTYHRFSVTAFASPEDIGAPLWDPRGTLLGIVSKSGVSAEILPSNTIASSFASLLSFNEIRHASLGITARDVSTWRIDGDRGTIPSRGTLVLSIAKNSPALKAGIQKGDVILQVERDILDGTADLGERLSEFQSGSEISLRILRNSEEMTIAVTLGSIVTSIE
ncbi:MAG: S1C family serine protease [bacterium]|nr:S1C family serine protease [bacterium]